MLSFAVLPTAGVLLRSPLSASPLVAALQHFFNLIFMLFIIRAGLPILVDHPRLCFNAGSRPGRSGRRCGAAERANSLTGTCSRAAARSNRAFALFCAAHADRDAEVG